MGPHHLGNFLERDDQTVVPRDAHVSDSPMAVAASSSWAVPLAVATGSFFLGISQGVADTQHTGRRVTIRNVSFIGALSLGPGNTACDVLSWALIWDHAPNGSFPVNTDIFLQGNDANSQLSIDGLGRFECVARGKETVEVKSGVNGGFPQTIVPFDLDVEFRPARKITINGNAGNLTEYKDGLLYLMTCSLVGQITLSGRARTWFNNESE